MTIGANSYGSVAEVAALTRIYLAGQSTYNSTTKPTGTQVEQFIDRASGVLNLALANEGFTIPVAQTDAKLACDQWVVQMAAAMVEVVHPSTRAEDNRQSRFQIATHEQAAQFAEENALGFKNLGVAMSDPVGQGVVFTGQDAQSQRSDPSNTALAQPNFTRGIFDS